MADEVTEAIREGGTLNIVSDDDESWLRIERYDDEFGCSWWRMEVSARTGSGARFSGSNRHVHFSGLDAFLAAFDAFIMDRSQPVQLEGTYGCRLRFTGDATEVWLQFEVGDAGAFGQRHALSGSFRIAQDVLLGLLAGFRSLRPA